MNDPLTAASSGRYELAAPGCVADDFGGEIVAINLNDGLYFSLRGLAHAVWQDLLAGLSPRAILDGLSTIDRSLADNTAIFIADLEGRGLIRPSTIEETTEVPSSSAALARQGTEPPAIEVFDDMAELMKADPIHDVNEELGWPVRRETSP